MPDTATITRAEDELVRDRLSTERNAYRVTEAGSDIGTAARIAGLVQHFAGVLTFELESLANGPDNAAHIADLPLHLSDALDHFMPADIGRVVSAHLRAKEASVTAPVAA